jgi:hypothetical protein
MRASRAFIYSGPGAPRSEYLPRTGGNYDQYFISF